MVEKKPVQLDMPSNKLEKSPEKQKEEELYELINSKLQALDSLEEVQPEKELPKPKKQEEDIQVQALL